MVSVEFQEFSRLILARVSGGGLWSLFLVSKTFHEEKVDFGLNKRQIFRVITCRSASLLLVERPDSFLSHRETNFPTTEDTRKIFPRKKIGYPKRLAISKFETVLFFYAKCRNIEWF